MSDTSSQDLEATTVERRDAGVAHDGGGFSKALREGTASVHREAERSGFVVDLLRGRASRQGYTLFLRNFAAVYGALEASIAPHSAHPLVAAFADPGLRRLPSLQNDLRELAGSGWAHQHPLLPEANAYVRAIEAAASGDPTRLAAHAYARYLGDLSGGQILRPLIARTLGLSNDMLRFYEFPDLGDLKAHKESIRRTLDTLAVDGVEAQAFLDEANAAFRHNISVSQAVSRALDTAAA